MSYALTNCTILDGTLGMEPMTGKAIIVEGDTIKDIIDASRVDATRHEVHDLEGAYVIPGLINMHVHLPATGKPKRKNGGNPAKLARFMMGGGFRRMIARMICEDAATTELMSGVTTIRTVGGLGDLDTQIRDMAVAGEGILPRVLASNEGISVPDGHMAGSVAYEAKDVTDAVAFLDSSVAAKPDLIKLMITGGVLDAKAKGEPGALKMDPAMVSACCDRAHELGYKVAAHVESPEGLRVALEGGVDSIEHGAMPDQHIIDLFKRNGSFLIATLSPALPYAMLDESITHADEVARFNGRLVFDGIVGCAKACLAEGIPVGLGTDTGCPFVTHYDMWRELVHFCRYCDVTPSFALHTATQVNAELAGIADITGTIEPGKCADLVVVEGNPLDDLAVLRDPVMVVYRGKELMRLKVSKYREVETVLDDFMGTTPVTEKATPDQTSQDA